MAANNNEKDSRDEAEVARLRDEALRRALDAHPTTHKHKKQPTIYWASLY